MKPILIIEAKATVGDLDKAVREVTQIYGRACVDAGYSPLAVAVAGTSEDEFAVRVFKWDGAAWVVATYEGKPIGWIPNRADADKLRGPSTTAELRPSIPSPEVLAARVEDQILADAEDALDSHVARQRLAELKSGTIETVSGATLDARLAAMMLD